MADSFQDLVQGRLLGNGAFGCVHLYHNQEKTEAYAVKTIITKNDSDADKVQKEIDIMRLLPESEHLVQFFAFDDKWEQI